MSYPKISVDTNKIKSNVEAVTSLLSQDGIGVAGVTKVFCGNPVIAQAYIDGGVEYLADSRMENLIKMKDLDIEKIMLRLPMISEAENIVRYADISLNSELATIKAISEAALALNKKHDIILMVDLGDLREGYFDEEDIYRSVEEILKLEGVRLLGVGTNMACYGGVIPERSSIEKLESILDKINKDFKLDLDMISGGNSATIHLAKTKELGRVSHLRLGETLVIGREPSYDQVIPGTVNDAFKLEVQVIEVKEKPSIPIGKIGKDAFGKIPSFEDFGVRKRMICAIGRQDIDHDSMFPVDEGIKILGGSSDHLILDGTEAEKDYKVGDIIEFRLEYVSILRAMTSEYVEKEIIR